MGWRARLRDALWWVTQTADRLIGDDDPEPAPARREVDEDDRPLPSSAPPSVSAEAMEMIAPPAKPKPAAAPEPLEGTREATLQARIDQERRRMR